MLFVITDEWLGDNGIDVDDFMELLADNGIDPYPNDDGVWEFEAEDANGDKIPDFLEGLIENPTTTNPSQGGAYGGL